MPGLESERAPVIVAGLVVLREILAHYGAPELTVSERDLLHGAALAAAELPEPEETASRPAPSPAAERSRPAARRGRQEQEGACRRAKRQGRGARRSSQVKALSGTKQECDVVVGEELLCLRERRRPPGR